MKKYRSNFFKQKLNKKFTIVIGTIVFIPVSIIFMILFQNIRHNTEEQALNSLKHRMNENHLEVQKTIDLCNMSTQIFLNYQNLNDFLTSIEEGRPIETAQLVEFYQEDIGMLEALVNSNPYLYQIRVYMDNDHTPEMMPILYKRERMMKQEWAQDYSSRQWQFNYKDNMYPKRANASDHTMGLITSIENYKRKEIGVIEVAVRMDAVFPRAFKTNHQEWACFVDEDGRIHTQSEKDIESKWDQIKEDIVDQFVGESQQETYINTTISGERVILGIVPIKELSGYMVQLVSMEEHFDQITKQRNIYLVGLGFAFIILAVLINMIVKGILKRFYEILTTINQIQAGDLDARVNQSGSDEMGELGKNINIMLDTIDELMHKSIKQELFMKNSEIRALQNQINAHFIYNVLESIKMMAEIDEKYEISDAITSLGKLLRYGMKWNTKNVTVQQEVEYIKNYLNLINLRFDYQINLVLDISETVYDQPIPKMSLQPVVENAIYHGIEALAEDTSIYIRAKANADDFTIEIIDLGQGMSKERVEKLQKKILGEIEIEGGSGNGIGLKNVQDRIQILFGHEYGITVISEINHYTKIIMKLPMTYKRGVQGS